MKNPISPLLIASIFISLMIFFGHRVYIMGQDFSKIINNTKVQIEQIESME